MMHMALVHLVQAVYLDRDHLHTNAYLLDRDLRWKEREGASNLNQMSRLHQGLHLEPVRGQGGGV